MQVLFCSTSTRILQFFFFNLTVYGTIFAEMIFTITKGDKFVIGMFSKYSKIINPDNTKASISSFSERDPWCSHLTVFLYFFFLSFFSISMIFFFFFSSLAVPPTHHEALQEEIHSPWQIRATEPVNSHWRK